MPSYSNWILTCRSLKCFWGIPTAAFALSKPLRSFKWWCSVIDDERPKTIWTESKRYIISNFHPIFTFYFWLNSLQVFILRPRFYHILLDLSSLIHLVILKLTLQNIVTGMQRNQITLEKTVKTRRSAKKMSVMNKLRQVRKTKSQVMLIHNKVRPHIYLIN